MHAALRQCRQLARHLPLPDPWRVEDLCAQIAMRRGRPIRALGRPARGDSITATLLATDTADYIFYREDLRGLHRDHAICHELGHLLAGHGADAATAVSVRALESMVLKRSCDYGTQREREAEAVADTIMQRVTRRLSAQDAPRRNILRGFGDALR